MTETVKNIDKSIELNGSLISYRSLPSYHMPSHEHSALQVLIPLEGAHFEISWAVENNDTEAKTLGAADVCIIPPLLAHEVRWSNCANFISLYITVPFITQHVEGEFELDNDIINAQIGIDDQMLYQLGQSVRYYLWRSEETNYKYLDAVLTVVSQHIACNYLDEVEDQILFNDFEQIPCVKIRESILYMQSHLDRNLNVEEIADQVGMSHYHFIRTFKQMIGMPPAKFHMMQRIEKAKQLLKKGNRIIDVAMELGFSSQSHFSNVFTKSIGVTPKKFASH